MKPSRDGDFFEWACCAGCVAVLLTVLACAYLNWR